jgi:NADP-dependent 3-hydroxy acid dehydrogenase YdfG
MGERPTRVKSIGCGREGGGMKPGSVFLVTGAAKGIGAATAELVVSHGHRVAVCDVDADGAAAVAGRLGEAALPLRLDVRDESAWGEALAVCNRRLGAVDVVVNNAGLVHIGFLREQSAEQIRHMIEVNFVALVTACRVTIPFLIAQGHGHVVNVGSLAGFVPLKGQAVYSGTKHAVRAFHHAIALEHADDPVDFSLVCPAAVDTDMLRQQLGHAAAALSFADQALSAAEVAQGIYHAVEHRSSEVVLPAVRGEMIRVLGTYPAVVKRITKAAEARGRRAMQKKAPERGSSDKRFVRG